MSLRITWELAILTVRTDGSSQECSSRSSLANGYAVLNADDPLVAAMANSEVPSCLRHEPRESVRNHTKQGGLARKKWLPVDFEGDWTHQLSGLRMYRCHWVDALFYDCQCWQRGLRLPKKRQ